MRFVTSLFLTAIVFVSGAQPLWAQKNLSSICSFSGTAKSRNPAYQEGRLGNSSVKPLTGGIDYRELVVDPDPGLSRTELTQLPGLTNPMPMRSGLNDFSSTLRNGKALFEQMNPFEAEAHHVSLPGDLSETELNTLLSHDIVIMQDRSDSMLEEERFPQGTVSRWHWCLSQSMDLMRQTTKLPHWSFNLVLFSNEFDVYRNVKLRNLPAIYETRRGTYVGTKLMRPVAEQLRAYFLRQAAGQARPLIIAVVTDGKPQDDEQLCSLIINTTKRLRDPDDIQIVFLQVGTDDEGQQKLCRLDYKLINDGARHDIVSVIPFEMMTRMGLARALVTAVQNVTTDQ